jgi:hypothetical protein
VLNAPPDLWKAGNIDQWLALMAFQKQLCTTYRETWPQFLWFYIKDLPILTLYILVALAQKMLHFLPNDRNDTCNQSYTPKTSVIIFSPYKVYNL